MPVSSLDLEDHIRPAHPPDAIEMAETADPMPPRRLAGDPDEPHPPPINTSGQSSEAIDRHLLALEATELARLRRNYSRASSYHTPSTSITTKKPTTVPERFTYSIRKFWRHQVSVTVEHKTCRDHLGMFCLFCHFFSSPVQRRSDEVRQYLLHYHLIKTSEAAARKAQFASTHLVLLQTHLAKMLQSQVI
jgi:hypothetical protein